MIESFSNTNARMVRMVHTMVWTQRAEGTERAKHAWYTIEGSQQQQRAKNACTLQMGHNKHIEQRWWGHSEKMGSE